MSPSTAASDESKTPSPGGSDVLPEEKFWKRYSPHHEFPLSTVLSATLYCLAGFLLFFAAQFFYNLSRDAKKQVVDHEIVAVQGVDDSGGPVNDPVPTFGPDAPAKLGQEPGRNTDSSVQKIPVAKPTPSQDPALSFTDLQRSILEETKDNPKALATLKQQLEDALKRDPAPKSSKETGRPGPSNGPSGPIGNMRLDRVRRWQLNFQVTGVEDHMRQFAALGAILAIPEADGRFLVFRNLTKRPRAGRIEDVRKIQRLWFIDTLKEHPEAVSDLARALGLKEPPAFIVAFFPETLEEEMARKEMAYRGKPENEIKGKILFDVRPRGLTFEVVVSPTQP